MRNVIILAVAIALSGCSVVDTQLPTSSKAYYAEKIPLKFNDFNSAWKWVAENIEYKADPPDGWKKTPWETYRDRNGDCEDYAILLSYFATTQVAVIKMPEGLHCVNYIDGRLIEPQVYGYQYPTDTKILYLYSFTEAMESGLRLVVDK